VKPYKVSRSGVIRFYGEPLQDYGAGGYKVMVRTVVRGDYILGVHLWQKISCQNSDISFQISLLSCEPVEVFILYVLQALHGKKSAKASNYGEVKIKYRYRYK
jgi:hypothetical protein